MKLRPAFLRNHSGTAAVELALCLPMMLALIFGGFEGGNYLLTEHKVVKGVRDGARYAARLPFTKFDCPNGTVDAASVVEIINVTRTGQVDGDGPIRVRGWGAGDVSVTLNCDDLTNTGIYASVGTAPRVLVASQVPYPSILGLLGFDTTGAVVRAQAQAAVTGI